MLFSVKKFFVAPESKHEKLFRVFCRILPAFLFLFFVSSAAASTLYFSPSSGNFPGENVFRVDVKIDTGDETINLVDVKINFSEKDLEIADFSDGGSLVNFWVKEPEIRGGVLSLAGITPGGFFGDGTILKLAIRAKNSNSSVSLDFSENSRVLLNSGGGNEANLILQGADYSIGESGGVESGKTDYFSDGEKDDIPPEPFEPVLGNDQDFFKGRYFIAFGSQDKDSGIDHYEISESKKSKIKDAVWVTAESPYVLRDQTLSSYVYVKAVDKAGNERIAAVYPKNATWTRFKLISSAVILFLVLLITAVVFRKKNIIRNKNLA
ncbi:MAG: hypothetical protein PHC85_01675 [Candidatus Pacebacteria bacterium]|nr:hypothetical protein [Candidatus Paceibacterota bacterium]